MEKLVVVAAGPTTWRQILTVRPLDHPRPRQAGPGWLRLRHGVRRQS